MESGLMIAVSVIISIAILNIGTASLFYHFFNNRVQDQNTKLDQRINDQNNLFNQRFNDISAEIRNSLLKMMK